MFQRLSLYIGLVFLFVISLTQISHAATLSIAPATVKVSSGNIVSVQVLVNTDGQAINTVSGMLQFPTDLLQVMSVSKSSSIFSLWVQDPSFSNTKGVVTFTGGVPNPGFTGQGGEILSIVFKAKKTGNASVIFSDSSILLNDGLGTDALVGTKPATVAISSSAQSDIPTIDTSANSLPAKPIVISPTNPSQEKWYSTSSASFSWNVPSSVTSIQTLLSKDPNAVPTVNYDSSVSQRTVNSIADGTVYFHIRYMNSLGWGPVAHYKVQIDSTPPEKFVADVTTSDVNNTLILNAVDKTSGIDHYSVQIDSDPAINVQNSSLVDGQFILPIRNQGNHTLEVIAYDKAGNHTEEYSSYNSPATIPPTIAIYAVNSDKTNPVKIINNTDCQLASVGCSAIINRNQSVIVKGETKYALTDINVYVQPEGKSVKMYSAKTAEDGSYSVLTDPLDTSGSASVWTQLVYSNGTVGSMSDKVTLQIKDGLIVGASKSLIYSLPFVIFAIGLLTGLIFVLYYGWHKFFGLQRRLRGEAQDAIDDTHQALLVFKDELDNQLNKLEKMRTDRELNKKEEKLFSELKDKVDMIEDFIEKKIKRIR